MVLYGVLCVLCWCVLAHVCVCALFVKSGAMLYRLLCPVCLCVCVCVLVLMRLCIWFVMYCVMLYGFCFVCGCLYLCVIVLYAVVCSSVMYCVMVCGLCVWGVVLCLFVLFPKRSWSVGCTFEE